MKNFLLFGLSLVLWLNSDFAYSKSADDKSVSPHFIINATQGTKVDFILAKQKIDAVIIGAIADVIVEQHYVNRGKGAIEGVYVFPASTRAAVYGMNMQIGKRLIIAQIKKKNDARQEYETAKKEGKRAALLEQFEDNVFKMNVANIMKGDTVITIMKYTENLDASNGIYEFVYPTVVAPRYVSPVNKGKNDDEYGEIPYIDTKLIPDFNFEMNVVLNSGLNIDTIYSKSHKFDFNYSEINGIRFKADAKLNDSEFPANRDIILNFSFASQIYQTGLMVNEKDKYFMLTLQPPKRIEPISIINREYIFVMDVSGSMNGFPIDISKNIMKRIISGLDENDLFNIVFFAGGSEMLFCMSQKADKMNKKFAEIFIDNQKGGGGTELLPALQKVMNIPKVKGYSRIIPILTDGEISISSETFNLIRNNIGDANIFSFGIGSSVNRDIIEGMARAGFGEKFIATNSEEGMKQGEQMLNMIDSPIMTDIKAEFNGWNVQDVTPAKIPDLFLNKPITIYGKYEGNLNGEIKISGQYGSERISVTMPLHKFAIYDSSNSIRYLAVRNKIAELNELYEHDYNFKSSYKDSLEKLITDLCLQNNLLSKFTSFIAVDYEIINKGGNSKKVNQINAVPKGMNKEFQNVDVMSRASSVGGEGVNLGGISAEYGSNHAKLPTYQSKHAITINTSRKNDLNLKTNYYDVAGFAQDVPDGSVTLNNLASEVIKMDGDLTGQLPNPKLRPSSAIGQESSGITQERFEMIPQERFEIINKVYNPDYLLNINNTVNKLEVNDEQKHEIIKYIEKNNIDNVHTLKLNSESDIEKLKRNMIFTDTLKNTKANYKCNFRLFLDTNGKPIEVRILNIGFNGIFIDIDHESLSNTNFQKIELNSRKVSYWINGEFEIKFDSILSINVNKWEYFPSKFTNYPFEIQMQKINYDEIYKNVKIPIQFKRFFKDSILVLKSIIEKDSLIYFNFISYSKSIPKRFIEYIQNLISLTKHHSPIIINGYAHDSYKLDYEINLNKCFTDSIEFNIEMFNLFFNESSYLLMDQGKIIQNHDTVKFRISIFDDDCNNYIYNKDMTYIIDTADPDGYFPFLFAGKGPGNFYEVEIPAADFLYKFPELELAKGKMVKVRVMIEE